MEPISEPKQEVINPETQKRLGAAKAFKFNPFDREFQTDPYPTYHYFRSQAPMYRTASFMGELMLTRYVDVKAVLNDPRFCVDDLPKRLEHKSSFLKQQGDFSIVAQTISEWLFFLDPPDHTRLRGLVSKTFSFREVENMRFQIQKIVDELISLVQGDGSIDIISDLACPLPATVTAKMLGVPTEECSKLTQWASDLFRVFDQPLTLQDYEHLNKIALEFKEYFNILITEREKKPKEDLLSNLIAARDQDNQFSNNELLSFCALLFTVGQETMESFIGNSMLALLRHPNQMEMLKQQPTMIKSAVEELLRYDSPVQIISRIAVEDVEIDGTMVQAGERVNLFLGAANRDPAQFHDPDKLNITRQENRNLPFGSGIHSCLGAAMARLQGQIAINTLVQRLYHMKLSTDKLVWKKNIVLRGLKSLSVTFTP